MGLEDTVELREGTAGKAVGDTQDVSADVGVGKVLKFAGKEPLAGRRIQDRKLEHCQRLRCKAAGAEDGLETQPLLCFSIFAPSTDEHNTYIGPSAVIELSGSYRSNITTASSSRLVCGKLCFMLG